jgi:hypothetical protein
MTKQKRILLSVIVGIILTGALTFIAFKGESRAWACKFAWQACLTQQALHTPDNAIHEGSPLDPFGFFVGVLLGVPIYGSLTYAVLSLSAKLKE